MRTFSSALRVLKNEAVGDALKERPVHGFDPDNGRSEQYQIMGTTFSRESNLSFS